MRFLLPFALCLLSFTAQAAFPPFQGFYGTNGVVIRTNPVTGIVQVDGSALSEAGTNQVRLTNSVFVSKNGSDSTGTRNNLNLPFLSLAAARNAAVAGDTVFVYPGIYNNASNLLKPGVNWQGYGATLTWTNQTNAGLGWGIFDDRFLGATTSRIAGFNLIWSAGIPGTNAGGQANPAQIATNVLGAIAITNINTVLDYEGPQIDYQVLYPHFQGTAAVHVKDCRRVDTKITYVRDINLRTNYYIGQDSDDEPVLVESQGTAYYWESGESHFKGSIAEGALYYGWWHAPSTGTTGNVWLTLDLGTGAGGFSYYTDSPITSSNHNWRSWLDIKESRGQMNFIGGGRHYIRAEKLSHTESVINTDNAVQLWCEAQKISSGVGWVTMLGGVLATLDLRILEYEDTSGASDFVGLKIYSNSVARIHGGHMFTTNGIVLQIGSLNTTYPGTPYALVNGATMVSLQGSPVQANTNGLTLKNVTLIGTNNQFGISVGLDATNAVNILGSYSRTPITNKVTMRVGPVVVDSNIQ